MVFLEVWVEDLRLVLWVGFVGLFLVWEVVGLLEVFLGIGVWEEASSSSRSSLVRFRVRSSAGSLDGDFGRLDRVGAGCLRSSGGLMVIGLGSLAGGGGGSSGGGRGAGSRVGSGEVEV